MVYPQVQVTYQNGTTQLLYLVHQESYDEYMEAKKLNEDNDAWDKLDASEQLHYMVVLDGFATEASWFKKGIAMTTFSPLAYTLLRGDGKLILPESQGGVHNISIKLV